MRVDETYGVIIGANANKPPTASSFVQSVASDDSYEESYPTARVIFDFAATSEFELDVSGALPRPSCQSFFFIAYACQREPLLRCWKRTMGLAGSR